MNKLANPIEYILQCLLQEVPLEKFHIRNAYDQWNSIKKKIPAAYALDNGDGVLYDLRKFNNPYNDQNKVVSLYRDLPFIN